MSSDEKRSHGIPRWILGLIGEVVFATLAVTIATWGWACYKTWTPTQLSCHLSSRCPSSLAQISATIAGFALISVSLGSPSERMRKRLRGIFQANVVALICFVLLGLLILPLGTNYEFGDLRY